MKTDSLFSIPMDRKTKHLVIICGILAVFFLILYIILCFFAVEEEMPMVYPQSGLSQSVFDSQNMVYSSVEGYSNVHTFGGAPFTIDTVDGQKAVIGGASIYQSGVYYFYYSELDSGEDVAARLRSELTAVLLLSADALNTSVAILAEERGYINGCEATFYVVELTALEGNDSVTRHMCLYVLDVNDVIYGGDKKLLVGCMGGNMYSVEGLEALKQLAFKDIYTLTYRAELEEKN